MSELLDLTFWGACDTVTGSCYMLNTGQKLILIDCGLFQGSRENRERNERPFPFDPTSIDTVLLTHAHIDHSGLLPKLVKHGFTGEIIATNATADLAAIMLPDSAHIQEMEAEWANRKSRRAGRPEEEPLYTIEDATRCLDKFRGVAYEEKVQLGPDLWVRFSDAGHILGSSIIECVIKAEGQERKIVFSGDLGVRGRPIIKDPTQIPEADIVVVESTYGNRLHEDTEKKESVLRDILLQAVRDNERVIIPAFAVGRTQDLLYSINKLYRAGDIPLIPVFVDSPLAVSATEIFARNSEVFDQETRDFLRAAHSPFNYPALTLVRDVEESKALNRLKDPAIIISASGMCEAGRIKHHLKHNLWRPKAHVLFVGYQAEGTLGRRIRDGAEKVNIFGEEITVKANIHGLDGFSAHADQTGLLEWLQGFTSKPGAVFVTHGEAEASRIFAGLVQNKLNFNAITPHCDESFDLTGEDFAPLAPAQQEEVRDDALSEIDTLWQQVRTELLYQLSSGGRRSVKEAKRLVQRLEESMREVRNRLGDRS